MESQKDLVAQLVELETKLSPISFQRHGCIYYMKDLEGKGLPAPDLKAESMLSGNGAMHLNSEFTLGPLTEALLWEGDRAKMALDQGPCMGYVLP